MKNKYLTTAIQPKDIDIKSHILMGSIWKNSETENSAYWLVKLAQKNKSWRDFTKKEIDKLCGKDFWFNGLAWGYITQNCETINVQCDEVVNDTRYTSKEIKGIASSYSFTDKFIEEVYRLTHRK